jgi:hypothetical protein
MQVLFLAVLIDALHAALKDRILAFNRVRGDIAASIFLPAMIDRAMLGIFAANFLIVAGFVRMKAAFAADVLTQDRRNVGNRRALDMEAAGRGAALDQGQNDILVCAAGLLLRNIRESADVGYGSGGAVFTVTATPSRNPGT